MDIATAAKAWATKYAAMWDCAESFHGSLNLSEAEALADLLAVAGEPNLAVILVQEWAAEDPEMATEHDGAWQEIITRYKAHPDFDPTDTRNARA